MAENFRISSGILVILFCRKVKVFIGRVILARTNVD